MAVFQERMPQLRNEEEKRGWVVALPLPNLQTYLPRQLITFLPPLFECSLTAFAVGQPIVAEMYNHGKQMLETSMANFAAVQMEPVLLEPERNLEKIIQFIFQASNLGAEVLVFPECATTGYGLSLDEARAFSELIPGPSTNRISDVCRDTNCIVVVGMLEKDDEGNIFNTAVLLGADGLLGKYRKTHLPYLGVDRFLSPGTSINGPFDTLAGKFGLLVCYDLRFPEPIRVLALKGAQAILLPTAWPHSATIYPDFMAQSRSAENSLYLIAANRIGEERGTRYLGRSMIIGMNGEKLAEGTSDQEEILLAEIEPTLSENKNRIFTPGEYELNLFKDRRPELYDYLIYEMQ
jgi:predicted amidohydrolase